MYNEGISQNGSLLDLGVEHKVLEKKGAWIAYTGNSSARGGKPPRTRSPRTRAGREDQSRDPRPRDGHRWRHHRRRSGGRIGPRLRRRPPTPACFGFAFRRRPRLGGRHGAFRRYHRCAGHTNRLFRAGRRARQRSRWQPDWWQPCSMRLPRRDRSVAATIATRRDADRRRAVFLFPRASIVYRRGVLEISCHGNQFIISILLQRSPCPWLPAGRSRGILPEEPSSNGGGWT